MDLHSFVYVFGGLKYETSLLYYKVTERRLYEPYVEMVWFYFLQYAFNSNLYHAYQGKLRIPHMIISRLFLCLDLWFRFAGVLFSAVGHPSLR